MTYSFSVCFIKWTLLTNFVELHLDLFRQYVKGISPKPCHHHGSQISYELILPERCNTTSDSISRLYYSNIHPESLQLLCCHQTSNAGPDHYDLLSFLFDTVLRGYQQCIKNSA